MSNTDPGLSPETYQQLLRLIDDPTAGQITIDRGLLRATHFELDCAQAHAVRLQRELDDALTGDAELAGYAARASERDTILAIARDLFRGLEQVAATPCTNCGQLMVSGLSEMRTLLEQLS